jgi:hypothetical protein
VKRNVALAYVGSVGVSKSWHRSIKRHILYDLAHEGHVYREPGGEIDQEMSTAAGLGTARNQAVREFLSVPELQWLWWTDTDMGFLPDALDKLLEAADERERPVVGALCFAIRAAGDDGMGGRHMVPVPTVYDYVEAERQFAVRMNYQERREAGELVQRVDGTGSAFLVIHRSVFEAIGDCWYDPLPSAPGKGDLGEDLAFCLRCHALGIPVHVHTGVPTCHHRYWWVGEPAFDAMRIGVAAIAEQPEGPA